MTPIGHPLPGRKHLALDAVLPSGDHKTLYYPCPLRSTLLARLAFAFHTWTARKAGYTVRSVRPYVTTR